MAKIGNSQLKKPIFSEPGLVFARLQLGSIVRDKVVASIMICGTQQRQRQTEYDGSIDEDQPSRPGSGGQSSAAQIANARIIRQQQSPFGRKQELQNVVFRRLQICGLQTHQISGNKAKKGKNQDPLQNVLKHLFENLIDQNQPKAGEPA